MKEKGSATLICVLLMSMMMIIVSGISRIVVIRAQTMHVKKSTANGYHLAESAVELFVDSMNRLIDDSHPQIIKTLKQELERQIFRENEMTGELEINPELVEYEEKTGYFISPKWVKMKYMSLVYQVLLEEYFYKVGKEYRVKTLRYEVKTEGDGERYQTQIKIVPYINAYGFMDEERKKGLINTTLLLELQDFNQYTDNELDIRYNEVFKVGSSNRYRDVISLKVTVETLDKKNQPYSKEQLIAEIKAIGLKDLDYKIIEKYSKEDRNRDLEQLIDLYMISVPLRVDIESIKVEDKKK